MITLKQWMELVDFKITEGTDYFLGTKQLYALDHWNGEQHGHCCSIVFDPADNQRVYIAEVCDYRNNRAYRISLERHEDDDTAWDGVEWTDLVTDSDFLEKARAILNKEEYDTRIVIPLSLSDGELLILFEMAHEADMTFNDYVAGIIAKQLTRMEK